MFCTKCGSALPNHAKFCSVCGASIIKNSDAEEKKFDMPFESNKTAEMHKQKNIRGDSNRKSNVGKIMLLVAFAIVITTIFIDFSVYNNEWKKAKNNYDNYMPYIYEAGGYYEGNEFKSTASGILRLQEPITKAKNKMLIIGSIGGGAGIVFLILGTIIIKNGKSK